MLVSRVLATMFAAGLGIAVTTGPGIAYAETPGSSASSGSNSSSSSEASGPANSPDQSDSSPGSSTTDSSPESATSGPSEPAGIAARSEEEPSTAAEAAEDKSDEEDAPGGEPAESGADAITGADDDAGAEPQAKTAEPLAAIESAPHADADSDQQAVQPAGSSQRSVSAIDATDTGVARVSPQTAGNVAPRDALDMAGAPAPLPTVVVETLASNDAHNAVLSQDVAAQAVPVTSAAPARVNPIRAAVTAVVRVATGLIGLISLGVDSLLPPPISDLFAGLFEATRRLGHRFGALNETPVARPVQTGQTADGVITGTLGAVDFDGDQLRYTPIIPQGTTGVLDFSIAADGTYRVVTTPAFAATGGTINLQAQIDDGTRALFGRTGRGTVPVIITVAEPGVPTATIPVGDTPTGVAVSPEGRRVYVTNLEDNTVSVIDTETNDVIDTIDVGSRPNSIALTPNGRAYVANFGANTVSVIDTGSNERLFDIVVGESPVALAVSPDGSRVYVANIGGDTVSVINTETNFVVATIGVGQSPVGVAVGPDGRRVYVVNTLSENMSVIDTATNRVVATAALVVRPSAIAVSPDGSVAYVTHQFGNKVSVVNTASGATTSTIRVGNAPNAVAFSPSGARAYVTNFTDGSVSVIDTASRTVIATVPVGTTPEAVAVNPIGALVYVTDSSGNAVSVIPVVSEATTAPVPNGLLGATRGVDIYNLTGGPIRVTGYTEQNNLERPPPVGTVVPVGGIIRYEAYAAFWVYNQSSISFRADDTGATFKVDLETGLFYGNVEVAKCAGSGDGVRCNRISRGQIRPNVALLLGKDPTSVKFGPGEAQDQTRLLNNLCYAGSPASCTFDPKRQIKTSGEKRILDNLNNNTSVSVPQEYESTDVRSQTESVKVSVEVSAKFLKEIVNAKISSEYGHNWTETHTFRKKFSFVQPPYTRFEVIGEQPIYRVYGDFVLNVDGVTFTLEDVYFDTPNKNEATNTTLNEFPLPSPSLAAA